MPKAFLQYLLQTSDEAVTESKRQYLTPLALNAWENLSLTYTAETDGYFQVLVANESDKPVWFDEVSLAVQPGLIVQETHYDPWGVELAGIEGRGNPEHQYKFQDKELIDELDLYLMDFHARYYDAQLGRWHAVDPADQFSSPFVAMGNNPVMMVDPDGEWIQAAVGAVIGAYSGYRVGKALGASGWKMFGYIAGGAGIGALTAGVGTAISSSGGLFTNTSAVVFGSATNSMGMMALSGGRIEPSISFGVGTYNLGSGNVDLLGEKGNSDWQNVGFTLGALGNLADATPFIDKLTHWEEKIATKANAELDRFEALGHTKDNVDPETVGKNLGFGKNKLSYPGPNNPLLKNGQPYYGKVPTWGPKEYGGYLHDLAYERAGIAGLKGYIGSVKAMKADWQFVGRQIYLSLKYSDLTGFLIGSVSGTAFTPKYLIGK